MHYLTLALKLIGVPLVLGFIAIEAARDPRLGALRMDPALIVAALAVNQLALALFAARMRLALRVFGLVITLRQALRVHLQSVFYYFVLPMTIGLEVARFAKIKAQLGENAPAARLTYALLADRVLGAGAAAAIALALLPFMRFEAAPQLGSADWLPWLGGAAIMSAALLLHPRVRAHAGGVISTLRSGSASLLPSFAMSLATHCTFALAIALAAAGTGATIDPLQALFAVSAAMLFVVIPVSFAGVSPAEAANFAVLVALGVPVEGAAVFAFMAYLAKLVAAVEGAAWEIRDGGGQIARLMPSRDE